MFALSPASIISATLSIAPATVSAPVSDIASTRLTAIAIPAPLSNSALTNDVQTQPQIIATATSAGEIPPTASVASSVMAHSGNANVDGPSVPFLVQALSQNEDVANDNEIALATTFAHFAPAPQYDTFLGYSIVKYRPSDAGLPSSVFAAPAATEEDAQSTAAIASEYEAYSATQSRNQSNLVSTEPQFLTAG